MPLRNVAFTAVVVTVAVAACSVKNVEMDGAYRGAVARESVHPLAAEMFNLAFKAVALPSATVSAGDYVAVYRLSSGKVEDQWWCYLAEDWLVDKVRGAGATPVERNAAATRLLEAEGAYFEPPAPSPVALTSPRLAKLAEKEAGLTPYRATRALTYRVVAADLWFDRFRVHRHDGEPTVRANAKVTVNLRTVDVMTGEVLWTGSAAGTASKTVSLSRLAGWAGICDWDDWDDGPFWWHWGWDWDGGPPDVAEPADGSPDEATEAEDASVEEPAAPDETSYTDS